MKIGIAQKQGFTQVDLAGAFKVDSVSVMREELDHLLSIRPTRVLWDLAALGHVAPQVFAEILRALAILKLAGGASVLLGPSPEIRDYLTKLSLDGLVPIAADPASALRMLAPTAAAPRRSEFVEVSLLGEILIDLGIMDETGLRLALDEQRRVGGKEKLGSILLRLNIVTPPQILSALETQYRRRIQKSGIKAATPPNRAEFSKKNLLGEILQEIGVLDEAGLKKALEEQRRAGSKEKLGDILLRLKIVTPDQLLRALEKQARR